MTDFKTGTTYVKKPQCSGYTIDFVLHHVGFHRNCKNYLIILSKVYLSLSLVNYLLVSIGYSTTSLFVTLSNNMSYLNTKKELLVNISVVILIESGASLCLFSFISLTVASFKNLRE